MRCIGRPSRNRPATPRSVRRPLGDKSCVLALFQTGDERQIDAVSDGAHGASNRRPVRCRSPARPLAGLTLRKAGRLTRAPSDPAQEQCKLGQHRVDIAKRCVESPLPKPPWAQRCRLYACGRRRVVHSQIPSDAPSLYRRVANRAACGCSCLLVVEEASLDRRVGGWVGVDSVGSGERGCALGCSARRRAAGAAVACGDVRDGSDEGEGGPAGCGRLGSRCDGSAVSPCGACLGSCGCCDRALGRRWHGE